MKNTVYLVIAIIATLLAWLFFGAIGAFIAQVSLHTAMCHPAMFFVMFCLGWIPAFAIIDDLENRHQDEYYRYKNAFHRNK